MIKQEKLKKIHVLAYEALEAVQKICDQYHIQFYLRGGSVLGAVKYQGIVPWDDDIDIIVPRKGYQKLVQVMPQELNRKFQFVCYQRTKNAHCYAQRIILKKELCDQWQVPQNNERGLSLLDILPLDGMPDGKMRLKLHIVKFYLCRILAGLWTIDVKDTVNMHREWQQRIMRFLCKMRIHHLYHQDAVYRRMDQMYKRYPYGETKLSGTLSSSKLSKEIMPTSWWAEGEEMVFGPLRVKVPKNYDEYLKQVFGKNWADYEPPAEKRKKSHLTGYGGR